MDEKPNILLLEDSAEDVELINNELSKSDFLFSLKVVETESDFLNALKSFSPDLILADYTLPSYDGLSALLSTREKYPYVPFIFVSGTIGEEKAIEAMRSGATDYVLKEKFSKLVPAVIRAIDEKDERWKRLVAEEGMMNSAREWKATFDAIDDAVCLINTEGKILRCNKAMAKFIGKPFAEIIGFACWEIVHGTEEPIAECPVLRMKETLQRETMLMHTGEKTLQVIVDPILDENGNLFQVVHIISDITEQKRAEKELHESEEKFRALYNNSPDMYVSVSSDDANILLCNETLLKKTGYAREEIIGYPIFKLYHDDCMDEVKKAFQQFVETGVIQNTELILKRKDGSKLEVSLNVSAVRDDADNILYSISSWRDITDRKRAERALRESEKKFSQAVQGNSIPTFIIDNNHIVTHWNNACENLTGFSAAEMVGTKKHCFAFHPEERPILADLIVDGATEEEIGGYYEVKLHKSVLIKGAYEGESLFPTLGENGKWLFFTAAPLKNRSGNIIGAIQTYQDTTGRKNMEDQLRQAQKMEAIGTLAGGVAHDFNNILTTIIGNAQLALMEVDKDGPLREEIEEIKTAGERAASLTRQLLAFSRKQIIQPNVLDLNELLTDIEKMLGRLISEDVELLTILEPALWHVEADPGQMEQVIMNLAVNAKDAMPKGGKLTIETTNVDLDENYYRDHGIKEEQPGSYVMLALSDTGIGMSEETRERIFEPFFTTKELGKGTGLGLSTIYGIVKQNNGFVWVYSEPGQGSTFKIYLPRTKGGVASDKKEQTPGAELGGSETVLIVEDDNALRKLARTVLKQKGYKVLEAENGEDALRVSEAHDGSIDLLITDVVMPKMGGRKTAERLQPLYPRMKVIYMSGYTDNAIAHHGVLEPGLNFIEKPYSPKALASKVREILNSEK